MRKWILIGIVIVLATQVPASENNATSKDYPHEYVEDKVPILGDIPIVGALFRSHRGVRPDDVTRSPTPVVSPVTSPMGALPIVSYKFDGESGKGVLVVDIKGKGIEARHWVVENIGMICSDKNITIRAGEENRQGGGYRVLDESVTNGLLSIQFEAVY